MDSGLILRMRPSNSHTSAHACRLLACVIALGWAGCASTGGGSAVGHYVVSVSQTPIFRYGPAQSFGADFSLTQGQHVVMLKREFGYSRVMTDEGQTGYVATEDLKPAPPPPAPPTPTDPGVSAALLRQLGAGGAGRTRASSANTRAVLEAGPLFGGEEPPLPARDPLQPGNAPPGFRISVPQRKATDSAPAPAAPQEKDPAVKPVRKKPLFRVSVPAPDSAEKKP